MFVNITKDEQITKMFNDICRDSGDSFKYRLIATLSQLDDNDWKNLEKLMDCLKEVLL